MVKNYILQEIELKVKGQFDVLKQLRAEIINLANEMESKKGGKNFLTSIYEAGAKLQSQLGHIGKSLNQAGDSKAFKNIEAQIRQARRAAEEFIVTQKVLMAQMSTVPPIPQRQVKPIPQRAPGAYITQPSVAYTPIFSPGMGSKVVPPIPQRAPGVYSTMASQSSAATPIIVANNAKIAASNKKIQHSIAELMQFQIRWYATRFMLMEPLRMFGVGVQEVFKYAAQLDSWEAKLLRWSATSGSVSAQNVQEVKNLTLEIRKASLVVPLSFEKIAEGVEAFVGAGVKLSTVKEITPYIAKFMSSFPETDMKQFGIALTGAFKTFKDTMPGVNSEAQVFQIIMDQLTKASERGIIRPEQFTKVMQNFAETGRIIGLTTAEIFAMNVVVTDLGARSDLASRALRQMMWSLQTPKGVAALHQMGIEIDRDRKFGEQLDEVMTKIGAGLDKGGITVKQAQAITGLGPTQARNALTTLAAHWNTTYKEYLKAIQESGGGVAEAAKIMAMPITAQWTLLKNTVKEFGQNLIEPTGLMKNFIATLLDMSRGALSAVNETLMPLKALGEAGKQTREVLVTLGDAFKVVGDSLSGVGSVFGWLAEQILKSKEAMVLIIDLLGAGLIVWLVKFLGIAPLVISLITGIGSALTAISSMGIVTGIQAIVQSIGILLSGGIGAAIAAIGVPLLVITAALTTFFLTWQAHKGALRAQAEDLKKAEAGLDETGKALADLTEKEKLETLALYDEIDAVQGLTEAQKKRRDTIRDLIITPWNTGTPAGEFGETRTKENSAEDDKRESALKEHQDAIKGYSTRIRAAHEQMNRAILSIYKTYYSTMEKLEDSFYANDEFSAKEHMVRKLAIIDKRFSEEKRLEEEHFKLQLKDMKTQYEEQSAKIGDSKTKNQDQVQKEQGALAKAYQEEVKTKTIQHQSTMYSIEQGYYNDRIVTIQIFNKKAIDLLQDRIDTASTLETNEMKRVLDRQKTLLDARATLNDYLYDKMDISSNKYYADEIDRIEQTEAMRKKENAREVEEWKQKNYNKTISFGPTPESFLDENGILQKVEDVYSAATEKSLDEQQKMNNELKLLTDKQLSNDRAAENESLTAKLNLHLKYLEDLTRIYNNFGVSGVISKVSTDMSKEFGNMALNIKNSFETVVNTIESEFETLFDNLLDGVVDWKKAVENILKTMTKEIIKTTAIKPFMAGLTGIIGQKLKPEKGEQPDWWSKIFGATGTEGSPQEATAKNTAEIVTILTEMQAGGIGLGGKKSPFFIPRKEGSAPVRDEATEVLGETTESFRRVNQELVKTPTCFDQFFTGIQDLFSKLATFVKGIIGSIGGASSGGMGSGEMDFSSFFETANYGDFAPMAKGGKVSLNKAYLVGENGPELFSPNSNGSIIPNGGFGGQPQLNSVVNVINQTKTPVSAKQSEVKFNGKEYIVNVVLDELTNNYGPLRHAVKGVK